MRLPEMIDHLRTTIRSGLTSTPFDYPTPHQRRAFYRLIGPWDHPISQQVRTRLALLAAQRALPLYQQMFPDDDLPTQLVDATSSVLAGTMDDARLDELTELAYHAAGHQWGYADDELPDAIDHAGQAAHRALSGATHGLYFLQDLDTGFGTMTPSGIHIITGGEWTNQRLLSFPTAADSALYAASAIAADSVTGAWIAEPWQAFWLWWLDEGLTNAWEHTPGTESYV